MKRTLALAFGLAAVLLFAPVARADTHGGIAPYRDDAGPVADDHDTKAADGHDDHGDNEGNHQEGADSHHDHEGKESAADDHDDHDDDGNGSSDDHQNPGTNSTDGKPPAVPPQGPSTASVPASPAYLLWVLLIAIAGGAAATAYVLRRRLARTR